jgi:hypothetical protein
VIKGNFWLDSALENRRVEGLPGGFPWSISELRFVDEVALFGRIGNAYSVNDIP